MRNKPLRQRQLAAIGMVTVEWSFLESHVHLAFRELLDLSLETGRGISGRIRRMDTLLAIIRERGLLALREDLRDRMDAVLIKIRSLEEERNHVTHAAWYANEDWAGREPSYRGLMQGAFPSRHGWTEPLFLTSEDLKQLAARISSTSTELLTILLEHWQR